VLNKEDIALPASGTQPMHDVADSDCGLEKKPVGHAAAIEPALPK